MWEMVRMRRQVERGLPPVRVAPRNGPFPLSPSQRRVWERDRSADPDRRPIAYNLTVVRRLTGPLDHEALRRGAGELVGRHEALRTVFPERGTGPVQLVAADSEAELSFVDGTARPAAETDRWLAAEAAHRFDLATGPLFRLALRRLGADDHIMFLSVHHIVVDGWSAYVMLAELSAVYGAYLRGERPSLPAPRLHLGDFVMWQRACLESPALDRFLAFGREQLVPGAAEPTLPPDGPRPETPNASGARLHFSVPAPVAGRLRATARASGMTLLPLLLAAWNVVLYGGGAAPEIVVGIPAANRGRREFAGVVGLLVNIVAVRTVVRDDLSFLELARRVDGVAAVALSHQAIPLERLTAELYPGDPLRYDNPLSTFFAVYQGGERHGASVPGTTAEPYPINVKDTHYPLAATVTDQGDGLDGRLSFNSDMYREATIRRLAENYRAVLDVLSADPETRVAALTRLR